MARKPGKNADISEALELWKATTEVRYDLAKEAYEYQDDKTKAVLDRIVNRLRVGAAGYIRVHVNPPKGNVVPVKVEQEYLDMNLLYVATEILKDCALFDIRIGTYKIPPGLCVFCGAELTNEKPTGRKTRRAA